MYHRGYQLLIVDTMYYRALSSTLSCNLYICTNPLRELQTCKPSIRDLVDRTLPLRTSAGTLLRSLVTLQLKPSIPNKTKHLTKYGPSGTVTISHSFSPYPSSLPIHGHQCLL